MDKQFFGGFSWPAAAMVCAAVLTPGAVFAADSSVVIVNPTNQAPATVDNQGDVHTLDYASAASHKITIEFPMHTADGCDTVFYTIPNGKALIITSMTGDYYNPDGTAFSGVEIISGASCSGNVYITHFVPTPNGPIADINYDYGNGIAIPNGVISVLGFSDGGFTELHGYLVPAEWVPATQYHLATAGGPIVQTDGHGPQAR